MINWRGFLVETIGSISEPLSIVLNASGCREGWLQGELYRAGRKHGLCVNEYPLGGQKKADLSCGERPDMLGEIKIVGALDNTKMQGLIKADAQQMQEFSTPGTRRYMILIIPKRDGTGKLAAFLDTCKFPHEPCIDHPGPDFRLRLWEF